VGQREVVDGVDDADAEVVSPDAVDKTAGEEWVVGAPHPREQILPGVLAWLELDRGPAQCPGGERALADRVALGAGRLRVHEDFAHHDLRLGLAGVLADLAVLLVDDVAGLWRDAEIDRAEDIGIGPVVVLSPAI